ncbi:MAG: D-2-hydroxyacid dehydrogenase [Pseudomonadota bacterium]|uniref:D-2-hydroxyacid dehydrogenase n=1 Tax=Vibrio TaxID=662 RepID=UPI0005F0534D|nr:MULTISPECIES: D-2-hydroxyacid dehydrogenase [Vibrio]MCC4226379.1 D-2-hydroxyacid dehydrogenase [Vibrio campbellii]MCC8256472.1 D-2-hydroxyacid dehydrogenase [Vibrio campbellii CAIM 333]MCE7732976.1 D-2-hydroxyacid dehydrogenase [Vibrio campbellii]MCR9910608.1 D-2-hydroxyacid dehydrogenase [Vibrio campbellii]MDK9773919.1 D-2-hydroxyacid dehydrogenase [Vibrio sp. B181a]
MQHPNQIFLLSEHRDTYETLLAEKNLPDLCLTDQPEEAQIVLADPPLLPQRLDEFSQLEWVQSTFAGVNALMSPDLRQDYTLTNVRGIFGPLIAEYVIGYCIAHFRHFMQYHQQQQNKQWQPHLYTSLQNKTMVILGTGSIGSHLGKAAQLMGMKTVGINRTGIPTSGGEFTQTFHINELASAFHQADIVVNTLPSTPDTQRLLNSEVLSHLNQALLFNVGRGDVIDDTGLLLALKNRWVEHAFLDVFEQEPLSPQHPFWKLPQVTITPHIAALSFPEQVVDIFADNYLSWRDGFSLNNQVDFDKGY